jgi:serine/threonine protein kinase
MSLKGEHQRNEPASFDGYKLKRFVAKGSSGQVYVTGDGDEVVKISSDIDHAVIEIGNMRALHHPNIVRMLDFRYFISPNGEFSLAFRMPKVRSRLDIQIKKVKTLESKLHLATQILEALRYLHDERRMIHRDIKPDNILIEPSQKPGGRPQVLLCDFGSATWLEAGRNYTAPISVYSYSAPETILTNCRTEKGKSKYTCAIDVFAFGCILWELLSEGQQGRYLGDLTDEQMTLHVHSTWAARSGEFQKDLRNFAPTPELGELLVGALHNQPELRFSASTCMLHIANALLTSTERPVRSGLL